MHDTATPLSRRAGILSRTGAAPTPSRLYYQLPRWNIDGAIQIIQTPRGGIMLYPPTTLSDRNVKFQLYNIQMSVL